MNMPLFGDLKSIAKKNEKFLQKRSDFT